jgi:hypothetical protein
MLGFDPTDLHNAGVDIGVLPDERGHLIDADALPTPFAKNLERQGLDMSKPIRVVGIIGRRVDGGLSHYVIHFTQDQPSPVEPSRPGFFNS